MRHLDKILPGPCLPRNTSICHAFQHEDKTIEIRPVRPITANDCALLEIIYIVVDMMKNLDGRVRCP
jgi:hypothetical protein